MVTTAPPFEVVARTDNLTRQEWLELRTQAGRIGGSDVGAVCGVSPWQSPYGLWVERTEGLRDDAMSEAAAWGVRLEDTVAQAFAEETGVHVHRWPYLVVSREHPFMAANLDRVASVDDVLDEVALTNAAGGVEVKTVGRNALARWTDDEGNDTVPEEYQLQVQHYVAVTGLERFWLPALIAGQELRVFELPRDDAVIDMLVEIEGDFHERLVTGTPPPIDAHRATAQALAKRFAKAEVERVEVPEEVASWWAERQRLKAQVKELEAELALVENALKAAVGDAELAVVNGAPLYAWRRFERRGIDLDRLRSEHPELAAELTTVTSYRTLSTPRKGD